MSRMRNIIKSTAEYTESFGSFRGVAREGDNSNPHRLAVVENLYRDYEGEGGDCLVSIPGFRRLTRLDEPIRAIFRHKRYGNTDGYVIHSGYKLFYMLLGEDGIEVELWELCEVYGERSVAFNQSGYLFIVCAGFLYRVESDGTILRVENYYSEGDAVEAYIPTLFKNGEPYEPRNLLNNKFYAEWDITDYNQHSYYTPSLRFSVIDEKLRLCAVTGIEDDSFEGELHIPGRVKLSGVEYRVVEISDSAFADTVDLMALYIGEGVERIGKLAFSNCRDIEIVFTPDTLRIIDNGAFLNCSSLNCIYLRTGLEKIGHAAFTSCYAMEYIYYSGDEETFNASVVADDSINPMERVFGICNRSERISFSVDCNAETIDAVWVDGEEVCYSLEYKDNGEILVFLSNDGDWSFNGKNIRIFGEMYDKEDGFSKTHILTCTIAEPFDGRVFLSGSPYAPNTVFYSARADADGQGAMYFGEFNYFNDGSGPYPVCSMMAVRDSLAVFKSDDDGSGTIFYHKGELTGDPLLPKIYPVSSIHSGICGLGASLNFLDDPLFISTIGVAALERPQLSYERSVGTRSTNINSQLLRCDLSGARMLPWMGYVAVCVEDKIFLGDPRATFIGEGGNREYEWFVINGVGAAPDEEYKVYFHSVPTEGCAVRVGHEDEEYTGEYYTTRDSFGDLLHYCRIDNSRYRLYRTGERKPTHISPPSAYMSDGNRLMFGTEDGILCIFNNDRRGIAPWWIIESEDFSEEEYRREMKDRLHPFFYSFDGISPKYVLRTVKTNCGVPHLTKSTVKGSLAVKYRVAGSTDMICEVFTDKGGYKECSRFFNAPFSFDDVDFGRLTLSVHEENTSALGEKEKEWIEKSVTFYSSDYERPIGIYSLAFRYKIHGRIKRY